MAEWWLKGFAMLGIVYGTLSVLLVLGLIWLWIDNKIQARRDYQAFEQREAEKQREIEAHKAQAQALWAEVDRILESSGM